MSAEKFIYKIADKKDYDELHNGREGWSGVYCGSNVDQADGFMHFATKRQVPIVLDKFFRKQPADSLVLIQVDAAQYESWLKKEHGGQLKWEMSSLDAEHPFAHAFPAKLPMFSPSPEVIVDSATIVEQPDGTFKAGELM